MEGQVELKIKERSIKILEKNNTFGEYSFVTGMARV
jgi:hypothetical protein